MDLDEFVFEVRFALIRAGLPAESGMLPSRGALRWHWMHKCAIAETVEAFMLQVRRYQRWRATCPKN